MLCRGCSKVTVHHTGKQVVTGSETIAASLNRSICGRLNLDELSISCVTVLPGEQADLRADGSPAAEKKRQDDPGDEASDMRDIGDAAHARRMRPDKLPSDADELQSDPAADSDQGWQPHDSLIGQELDRAARKHHEICAENPRNGAGGAHIRQRGIRNIRRLRDHGGDAG